MSQTPVEGPGMSEKEQVIYWMGRYRQVSDELHRLMDYVRNHPWPEGETIFEEFAKAENERNARD